MNENNLVILQVFGLGCNGDVPWKANLPDSKSNSLIPVEGRAITTFFPCERPLWHYVQLSVSLSIAPLITPLTTRWTSGSAVRPFTFIRCSQYFSTSVPILRQLCGIELFQFFFFLKAQPAHSCKACHGHSDNGIQVSLIHLHALCSQRGTRQTARAHPYPTSPSSKYQPLPSARCWSQWIRISHFKIPFGPITVNTLSSKSGNILCVRAKWHGDNTRLCGTAEWQRRDDKAARCLFCAHVFPVESYQTIIPIKIDIVWFGRAIARETLSVCVTCHVVVRTILVWSLSVCVTCHLLVRTILV